ncbi:hypothetical protein HDU76_001549 [Blyttiomyces sp. JEL0837]|nr:hypothetical protein HDU76_001549 [Blyttiomyces sp. JEL0837]
MIITHLIFTLYNLLLFTVTLHPVLLLWHPIILLTTNIATVNAIDINIQNSIPSTTLYQVITLTASNLVSNIPSSLIPRVNAEASVSSTNDGDVNHNHIKGLKWSKRHHLRQLHKRNSEINDPSKVLNSIAAQQNGKPIEPATPHHKFRRHIHRRIDGHDYDYYDNGPIIESDFDKNVAVEKNVNHPAMRQNGRLNMGNVGRIGGVGRNLIERFVGKVLDGSKAPGILFVRLVRVVLGVEVGLMNQDVVGGRDGVSVSVVQSRTLPSAPTVPTSSHEPFIIQNSETYVVNLTSYINHNSARTENTNNTALLNSTIVNSPTRTNIISTFQELTLTLSFTLKTQRDPISGACISITTHNTGTTDIVINTMDLPIDIEPESSNSKSRDSSTGDGIDRDDTQLFDNDVKESAFLGSLIRRKYNIWPSSEYGGVGGVPHEGNHEKSNIIGNDNNINVVGSLDESRAVGMAVFEETEMPPNAMENELADVDLRGSRLNANGNVRSLTNHDACVGRVIVIEGVKAWVDLKGFVYGFGRG